MTTTKTREQLAREAFWGQNESLMLWLRALACYEQGGTLHLSTGLSLSETIALAETLTDDELETLERLGVIQEAGEP